MKQTAVEWLIGQIKGYESDCEIFQIAKEMENQRLINLVQSLKDYTHESHAILGHDERDASEFVEIFKQQEQ
jgi:hypothetical protein